MLLSQLVLASQKNKQTKNKQKNKQTCIGCSRLSATISISCRRQRHLSGSGAVPGRSGRARSADLFLLQEVDAHQANYSTIEMEALAWIPVFKHFQFYLVYVAGAVTDISYRYEILLHHAIPYTKLKGEMFQHSRKEGRKEMFYLTTHSTHFIYASDLWLRTILIVRKETRCGHIGYSFRLTARDLLYHHPTDRITHTTAFVTPVVEHWLERKIAQWVHPMKDRSDDPSHHERIQHSNARQHVAGISPFARFEHSLIEHL